MKTEGMVIERYLRRPLPTRRDLIAVLFRRRLVILEMFAASEFMDVSLNQWIRRLPYQILKDHLNFDKAEIERIPSDKLEVV